MDKYYYYHENEVENPLNQTVLLTEKCLRGVKQKKRPNFSVCTIVFVAVTVMAGVFYGCRKDLENMESLSVNKRQKSNYQQPTKDVDINTVFILGDDEYSVVGNSVVGIFNGQIYECSVMWTMVVDDEEFAMQFTATLSPEYHDTLIPVEHVMDNYIIEVTNPEMITTESISDLWERVVEICDSNMETNYPFILPENMQPYQYAVYKNDFSIAFNYMQTVFDNYQEWEEWGYFMLSLSANDSFIYYGFITESSSYYDQDIINNQDYPFVIIVDPNDPYIVIDDDGYDDGDDPMVYGIRKFSSVEKAEAWVLKKREKGYHAGIIGNDKNGKIVCAAFK